MISATGKCHTCGNASWIDECKGQTAKGKNSRHRCLNGRVR